MGAIVLLAFAATLASCSPGTASPKVAPATVDTPAAATAPAPAPAALGAESVKLTPKEGQVALSAAALSDGRAQFYSVQNGNKWIPFFVVQGADGVVRAALDACDVCYESHLGFRQEGDAMVCNACGNRFPVTRINVEQGGCNPVGLKAVVRGDQVIIGLADLEAGTKYF